MGLFGQASKLVTNMFGGGKKVKPEPIKSVQLAHVAAKRVRLPFPCLVTMPSRPQQQQDDKEKQSDRLKTQEARRQQVKRRKEEAKARQLEDERKAKEEDMERRKREREENTDKRPLKLPTKKVIGLTHLHRNRYSSLQCLGWRRRHQKEAACFFVYTQEATFERQASYGHHPSGG